MSMLPITKTRRIDVGPRAIDIAAVQSRMLTIRNQQVLLDRDVAALYGVQTKEINQAQSDGRKVEVDGSKGQFVSEYFRTSCPSYYKRDYFDKMF